MPLPTLNTPKYTLTLPSNGKSVEYRPFLVKEEKILLLAQESNSEKEIMKAVKDIIYSCTFEKVNADDCTLCDIEYIFLQLRAKSVGEIAKISIRCSKCGEYVPIEINLNEVEVWYPEKKVSNNIQLTDSIGITLKPFSLRLASQMDSNDDLLSNIAVLIETIYDDLNVYTAESTSKKEMSDFIDSLNRKQLEMISEYIDNQPQIKHTVKFKCEKCGHENEYTFRGIQSFFG